MTSLRGVLSLHVFLWTRKLKEKKGIEENNMTTLHSLILSLFVCIENYFHDWISETQFKIVWIFLLLTGPKEVLGIIPDCKVYKCYKQHFSFIHVMSRYIKKKKKKE